MFSSTHSLFPSPHFPSSSYHPFPPPFFIHEGNDIFLHQNHLDPLAGPFLPTNAPFPEAVVNFAVSNNPAMSMTSRQNNIGDQQQQQHGFSNFLAARKPLKKDRHSKIYTAQGLRDRRVRLSIEIARKFFDLQDMLGFDKASKTLDWLLTKSSKAIKQVAKTKQSCSGGAKSLSSTSECEVVSGINEVTDSEILEGIVSKRKSLVCVSQEKKMKKLNKATIHLLAKESRAKARERARERTREKLCTRRLHESRKCPAGPQMRPPTQLEACERSSKVVVEEIEESSSHQLANHQLPRENIIEESIVIKRKLKPTSILGCQQNLVISNNDSTNCFPNLPLNWDINSSIARSTYCSITNMNLSTELQICGKTMEAGNILRLH